MFSIIEVYVIHLVSTKQTWQLMPSGRITRGPEGAWPPERPGGPRETSDFRGYKEASKRPPEIDAPCQLRDKLINHARF